MAFISARKNKTGKIISYYLRWYENGRPVSQNLYTRNKTKANQLKKAFEAKQVAEALGIIETNKFDQIRIDDAISSFIKYKKAKNLDEGVIRQYIKTLGYFRNALKSNLYLDEIGNKHLTPFIEILNKGNRSPSGINAELLKLNTFANWCFRNYRLEFPILKIDREVLIKDLPEINRFISKEEFAEICKKIDKPIVLAAARISIFLGLREIEIAKANLIEDRGIKYLRVYGKKNKKHVMPLFNWLMPDWKIIEDYRASRGFGNSQNSEKIAKNIGVYISKYFTIAAKAAGVHLPCYNCDFPDWKQHKKNEKCPGCGTPFLRGGNGKTFHGLRYHFNTNTSINTSVNDAQDIIGHSSRQMTEHYIKNDELAEVQKKSKILGKLYGKE